MNPPYLSYLLRVWQALPPETYRASLENARTHEVTGFADLQALVDFLKQAAGDENLKGDKAKPEEPANSKPN